MQRKEPNITEETYTISYAESVNESLKPKITRRITTKPNEGIIVNSAEIENIRSRSTSRKRGRDEYQANTPEEKTIRNPSQQKSRKRNTTRQKEEERRNTQERRTTKQLIHKPKRKQIQQQK